MAKKILLSESDIPDRWYNVLPDLPGPPAPYLNPATLLPMGPADLAPIVPQAVIDQAVSAEPWIDIAEHGREIYTIWRPSPVYRADRFEKALDTPAHLYFKYEGVSPAGSHKPNTAVAQAYYNSKEGVKRLTTETGAGQWGSALAFAGALFGLEVTVYMVKVSYEQKPYRRAMMETWGATGLPVRGRQAQGPAPRHPLHRGGTGGLPDAHARRLCLRLRRRRRHRPCREDAHPGAQLRARSHPLRWAALPRRRALALLPRRQGRDRAARVQAERVLRGSCQVRALGRLPAGAGGGPRHPGGGRRGGGRSRGGRLPHDPLQPPRARPLRHVRL